MRDVDVWMRLSAVTGDSSELAERAELLGALDELARGTLVQRAPMLGLAVRFVDHADSGVRAAAVRALAGVTGIEGLRAVVAALDDDVVEVRIAAVDALFESARTGQELRLAHALFHPRADVRARVIGRLPSALTWLATYLRGDPFCASEARALPLRGGLRLALDLHGRGLATDEEVCVVMAAGEDGDGELAELLRYYPRRSKAELDDVASWLRGRGPTPGGVEPRDRGVDLLDRSADPLDRGADLLDRSADLPDRSADLPDRGVDLLDRIVAIIDDASAAGAGANPNKAIPPLVRAHRHADTGARLVVAIVLRMLARGSICDALLTLAVREDPTLLAAGRIPVAERQRAARLLTKREPRVRPRQQLGEELLGGPLVRRPDGSLDLRVAASLAWLLDKPQLGQLVTMLGLAPIVAAIEADEAGLVGLAGLCELPILEADESREYRREHAQLSVHELLPAIGPERRARAHAAALAAWASAPAQVDRLLTTLTPSERHAAAAIVADEADATDKADRADRADRADKADKIRGTWIELGERALIRLADRLASAFELGAGLDLVRDLIAVDRLRPFKAALIERLLREVDAAKLALLVAATPAADLIRLIGWLREGIQLPISVEQQLAAQVRIHPSAAVRLAAESLIGPSVVVSDRLVVTQRHRLSTAEAEAIATCAPAKLANALAPALAGPSLGLPDALARRVDPRPSIDACVALLAAHDPVSDVAEAFLQYFDGDDPQFHENLVTAGVSMWCHNPGLPPLGHAWLHKWERHALAFGESLLEGSAAPLVEAIARVHGLTAATLRVAWLEATAYALMLWRYREPARFATLELGGLASWLVEQLDTELGPAAAKLLTNLHLGGVVEGELAALRERVQLLAPDLDRVTRHELHRWVRIDGLPDRERGARVQADPLRSDLLTRLRTTEDLELLGGSCLSNHRAIVEEAVLRLLEFGEAGEAQIVLALAEPIAPPRFDILITSVAMWTSQACVDDVRALARDPSVVAPLRFRMALALGERGEAGQLEAAIAALREPDGATGWFKAGDWARLLALEPEDSGAERALALALADSPHPHAFQRAITVLLEARGGDETLHPSLRAFLAVGTERPTHLRRAVAERLLGEGDVFAAPVLLGVAMLPEGVAPLGWIAALEPSTRARVLDAAVSAALVGGNGACTQRRVANIFDVPKLGEPDEIAREAFDRGLRRLFLDSTDDWVRTHLAQRATSPEWRRTRLQGIASIFAWGVRRGRELTGRLFRVHMTDRRQDFGYTLLDEDRIFVSPLPYFANHRHGQDIVEALILHEFGHHMFHRGPEASEIWKRAQKRGLHNVLNLVADEHLERNLRSLRADYGDRLKRLGAHAFLHAERDLDWAWLVEQLGASSLAILSTTPTVPAHAPGQLRIQRGDLLQALEAGGSSWARFVRALRMGLGDRWGDAKVRAGLELFKGGFRHADMPELWRVTLALAELFATELPHANVCGGHETLGDAGREGAIGRGGVGDEEVQDEVERILDPRQLDKGGGGKPSNKLAINVGADDRFDLITEVRRVARDPDAHRKVARELARHTDRLRTYLRELGLDLVPRRARLQGRSFDRTRTQAVVLRRDPRMLVARELEVHSDLFIGVLVDCSGSMALRDHLPKATRFAVLIAEAVRGLPGVDARFWGFTDSVIWDAGDAERCAVTSLETSGGNNDAAALYHAAQAASGSRRKAKILVMISDGLPTQCSVAALRNLVIQLGRRQQIVCAQVAVRPLEEVCFPHYVLLADEPIELATMRFGELVSKLARRALGR